MNHSFFSIFRRIAAGVALWSALSAGAYAQDYQGGGGGYTSGYSGGGDQYYGVDRGTCNRASLGRTFEPSQNNIVGSLLGAAAGGLLGSQFGHGGGKSAMTILGVLGGAVAGGAIGRSMERPDAACVNETLERAPSGRPVSWQNPDNGASYSMVPDQAYNGDDGRPCRNYVTTAVIDGQEQTIHGTACRRPDGTWHTQN
jgi:surface antigen